MQKLHNCKITMEVTINKKTYHFEDGVTVEDILKKLEISTENGIAVALNYSVVPKSNFGSTRLKQGDVLEIIHATAGG